MVYVHVIINSVLNTSGKGYRRFLKMHLLSFICMVFLWFLFMWCSFGTLLICCSAPFVSRFFIFSFCLSLYCFFFGLRRCCSFGILFIYFYCFIVVILCCIFVFLFTYMHLTFVEVHICSAPDLCIFSFEILF